MSNLEGINTYVIRPYLLLYPLLHSQQPTSIPVGNKRNLRFHPTRLTFLDTFPVLNNTSPHYQYLPIVQ